MRRENRRHLRRPHIARHGHERHLLRDDGSSRRHGLDGGRRRRLHPRGRYRARRRAASAPHRRQGAVRDRRRCRRRDRDDELAGNKQPHILQSARAAVQCRRPHHLLHRQPRRHRLQLQRVASVADLRKQRRRRIRIYVLPVREQAPRTRKDRPCRRRLVWRGELRRPRARIQKRHGRQLGRLQEPVRHGRCARHRRGRQPRQLRLAGRDQGQGIVQRR